jgi:gamma-glutamyltranspeptidase/glutathione hydrolase
MLQVFLNVVAFGMSMQQAIEAPRIGTFSFPNSFAPHSYLPGRLCLEQRIAEATATDLARRGYDIERWADASWHAGAVCAIARDRHTGLLHAGVDMRREAYAAVW